MFVFVWWSQQQQQQNKMKLTEAKPLLQYSLQAISNSSLVGEIQLTDELKSNVTKDDKISVSSVCRLWGGKGYVYNVAVVAATDAAADARIVWNVIVKRVSPTGKNKKLSLGDQRKADSYQVEANFYMHLAPSLLQMNGFEKAIPRPYHVVSNNENDEDNGITICMSKLTGENCFSCGGEEETYAVLDWLATFHAATWNNAVHPLLEQGLAPNGGYWYLDTRPDEHASMRSNGWQGRLKRAARAIDERLKRDKWQCIIHGDAKDANMLFFQNKRTGKVCVSMYDFQYCGKAPPTKDLAYFLCVAAHDDNDPKYLAYYHEQLLLKKTMSSHDHPTLQELQDSLQLAYCDWARFMAGWGFWGTDISHKVIVVLDRLDGGKDLGSEDAYREAVLREYG